MPTTCCVVKCGSRGDRDPVKFYKIPTELHFEHRQDLNELSKRRRVKWLQAIRRSDLSETTLKYARVCNKHFLSGKPAALIDENDPDWLPSLHMGYGDPDVCFKRAKGGLLRKNRAEKRRKVNSESTLEVTNYGESSSSAVANVQDKEATVAENEKDIQTDVTGDDITLMLLSLEVTKSLETKIKKLELCYDGLRGNDEKTRYYTGLNTFKNLERVTNSLEPLISRHFNSSLPVSQQILLTLVKLRLNLDFKDLAYRFGICPTTASAYFKKIIDVMHTRFRRLIVWPSREMLRETMPTCFREQFGDKISVVIDCFELFIEKPSNMLKSAQCWSNYKHHHTLKFLIGITPQGTVSFISEAWGGRASDKYITVNSKFLDNIIPGDVILADRGFLIHEFVNLLHAKVNIPAFTKGKNQLHPLELESTRSIANVRIHVERVIGCIRQKYKILSCNMPISILSCGDEDPILNKIVTVCCALINICPPIVRL